MEAHVHRPRTFADRSSATVAIATCAESVGVEKDDLLVIEALRRHGLEAAHAAWDDAGVDWSSFALVVVRSTWDYTSRRDEFLAWASRLRRVLNPLPILRWNTDKRYLDDLARSGVPVIPTRFLGPEDAFEPPSCPFVIKPAVSCGARDTARYHADHKLAARRHVHSLQSRGQTVMVQPYCSEIETAGETAVVFLGGTYSHSIRRDALLKQVASASQEGIPPANVRSHAPTANELRLAERAMASVPGGPSQLLYGRVDIIPGMDGGLMVLEVELTEPALFLEFGEGAVERLARCIVGNS